MNTSNITKSALALALGLCATGALAVTQTVLNEDFEGNAFANGVNTVATNNLTWADTEGYSAVSAGKLVVDATTNAPTSATLDSAAADSINGAFGRAKFNATVTFVPATEDPTVGGGDLKFALYAKAVTTPTAATNLYVIANGGAQPTGITLTSVTDQNVEVAFTAANTFTVKVGDTTSSAFTFANNGDIAKVEFSGNGEVEQLGFSYELATVSVTVTGDTANLTAAWEVDGEPVGSAPATLTEGQTYSVTFSAASGYAIKDGQTASFSGTAETTAISIAAPQVEELPSYEAGDKPVEGEGGSSYQISEAEAQYLNDLVAAKGKSAVETALASISATDFAAATVLNEDITAANAGKYSFKITKISKSGNTVTVTASLVRKGTILGDILGTATLYTASTPALLESAPTKQSQTFSLNAAKDVETEASVTFTGADKFFKVVIE